MLSHRVGWEGAGAVPRRRAGGRQVCVERLWREREGAASGHG